MSERLLRRVADRFPDAVVQAYTQHGDETVVVRRESLVEVARFCKEDPELLLTLPLSLTCVDLLALGETPRFELVYTLYSIEKKEHLRLKVRVPEEDPVAPSVISVWRGMDYWERYCWDMYGIRFEGREPAMKRLWLYEEFVGHPLRKDYPLRGRQPLTPELEVQDIYRGPGPGPGSLPSAPRPAGLPVIK